MTRRTKTNGMKNKETLDSFVKYCKAHPEQRFWQALRNWSGYDSICATRYDSTIDDEYALDTFYWTNRNKDATE